MIHKLQSLIDRMSKELPGILAAAVVTVDDGMSIAAVRRRQDIETDAASAVQMAQGPGPDGRSALWIVAGERTSAAWCAKVVLGRIYPNECRLFGAACTPRHPIGPCMVSDEGACRIWWSDGVRESVWAGRKAAGAES